MSLGKDIYAKTAIGTVQKVSAALSGSARIAVDEFERFQLIVDELKELERAGLIVITLKHTESTSGRKFVDVVQFRRLQ